MSQSPIVFVDLAAKHAPYVERYVEDLRRVLTSGSFILGNEVRSLETEIAAFVGCRHAVAVANGTDALVLALKACGVGQGDEVITTPMSYLATTSSIALCGATAVFVDVDDSLNLAPAYIEQAITPQTKAISLVHLAGLPADIGPIMEIAARHNLPVIEDCAQSFGATYQNQAVGTFGRFGAISFHPLKNLGTPGDGGLILVRDEQDDAWLRLARNHGHRSREECDFWSINSRLDEVHAAFLRSQLPDYRAELKRRRHLAAIYRRELTGIVDFPAVMSDADPSYNWIMVLAPRRTALIEYLADAGIETKIHYPMLISDLKAAERNTRQAGTINNARRLVDLILSLPSAEHISEDDVLRVCQHIRTFYQG